jgi:hypothetical protein
MDQNARKIGLINWMALLAVTVGLVVVSNFVSSAAGMVAAIISGLGFLVAILSYFQMGLEERERLEGLEIEELSKSHGTGSLFESAGEDTFPARRSRQLFERYFVPEEAYLRGGFSWIKPYASKDGDVLAVEGCYLGQPCQVVFYDISKPMSLPYREILRLTEYGGIVGWKDQRNFEYSDEETGEVRMVRF